MNEERFKNRIERKWGRNGKMGGNVTTGLFFLVIGALLMSRTVGADFPDWFFTWPMILIGLGIFIGLRQGFRSGTWIILLLVGGIFLADKISDEFYLRPYFWPIMFFAVGIYIILAPGGLGFKSKRYADTDDISNSEDSTVPYTTPDSTTGWDRSYSDRGDMIDITAIFAGVKKKVLSKNFKGGDTVAIMGGSEIDLTKADFNGKIVIDSFTMFGGTKLIVPPDWDIQSQVVAIFGGVDDKRPPSAQYDPSKIVFLEGTCLFGGIEIKSF
jgi:predicted membrane protein